MLLIALRFFSGVSYCSFRNSSITVNLQEWYQNYNLHSFRCQNRHLTVSQHSVAMARIIPPHLHLHTFKYKIELDFIRRGVRVAEGARLESVCAGNGTVGSNPTLSEGTLVYGTVNEINK